MQYFATFCFHTQFTIVYHFGQYFHILRYDNGICY